MELTQLVGIGGAPFVESTVEFLKDKWEMPGKLAPIASIIIALLFNFLLAWVLKTDFNSAFSMGIVTALASNIWHENKQ